MPYRKIVFIKLFLSLFEEDDRFLYKLNESQQLLYLKLLYLAGITNNEIPKNFSFIKNKINYSQDMDCLAADLNRIMAVFSQFVDDKEFYKFNKFDSLHNFVQDGNSLGTPLDFRRSSQKENKKENKKEIEISKTHKNTYGEHGLVMLTEDEYKKLSDRLGESLSSYVSRLEKYVGQTGKNYKSHYFTILNWYGKDNESGTPKNAKPARFVV